MNRTEPFRAHRTAHNSFELCWPAEPGILKVAIADSPKVLNEELIYEAELDASAGRAEIFIENTIGALFFHLLSPSGAEHIITDRALPTEGVRNFRDFGGYHTSDGQRVRWQMLYRSGHLGTLTDKDRALIASLNIDLVCDFRTQPEMDMNPSSFAPGHTPKIAELKLNPGDNLEFIDMMKSFNDSSDLQDAARGKMRNINQQLALSKTEVYREMFQALLHSDGPYLIHCSAGKDRTGFGAAIILTVLGVPEEAIFHDYLLSNNYTDPAHSLAWYNKFTGSNLNAEAATPLFEVHGDYLKTAFDAIYANYQDMNTYIRDEMRLDDNAINTLRQRLLEKA